jgi:hypothetical protein
VRTGTAAVLGVLLSSGVAMAFEITSAAFPAGGPIPRRHTCDGEDVSPPLAWKDAPAKTQSFALVCDDPDAPAGTWVHWVIYGIPASASALAEGVKPTATLEDGSRQGKNDFRRTGWGGPCPPRGTTHRYFFRLWALDRAVELPPGATRADLEQAVAGHTLGKAELMGRYTRP